MNDTEFDAEERLSQYPQLIFKFGGKSYKCVPLSLDMIEKLSVLEKSVNTISKLKSRPHWAWEKLQLLVPGLDNKTLKKIDIRIAIEFVKHALDFMGNPDNYMDPDVKKNLETGESKPKA